MNKTKLVGVLVFLCGVGLLGKFYAQRGTTSAVQNAAAIPEEVSVVDTGIRNGDRVSIPEMPDRKDGPKNIKRLNLKMENVVLVLDEINESAVTIAQEILTKEQKGAKELYILINSPGGSVFDGALIISAIQAAKIPVNTVCLQLCASMAAMIHAHGMSRYAVDRSVLMYHPASGGLRGTVPQMLSQLKWIDNYVNKIDKYISKRAGISNDHFLSELNNELWLDAEDATKRNFNDEIVSVNLNMNKSMLDIMQKVSIKMKERLLSVTR